MKKILSTITTVLLLLVIAVSCAQDVTVDTQLYGAQGSGTFMLNGKYYNTLQEAVNARLGKGAKAAGANDDVIYLTRNAKGPGAKIDDPNISVIIDFAGWTYSFTDVTATQGSTTGTFGLSITGGADVTLKGLEQIDLHDATANLTMVYVEGADTKLTIEDAPKMKVEPTQYVFWAANGATLTIGGETTMTGGLAATGTEEKTPLVSINDGAKADVSNMKLESAKVIPNSTKDLKVSTLESSGESKIINSGRGDVTVTKSEGTVVVQNTGEGTVKVDENTIPEGQAKEIEDGQEKSDVTVSVAMIGKNEYQTLQAAFNNAVDGNTVVLLADVALNSLQDSKTIFYKLNNHVFTDYPETTYDGNLYAAGRYAGGAGVDSNPYLLKTLMHFDSLSIDVDNDASESVYYKLIADFVFDDYAMIGSALYTSHGEQSGEVDSISSFKGHLDGDGHTVSYSISSESLTISSTIINNASGGVGLFGCIEEATVENLIVDANIDWTQSGYVGGLAGVLCNCQITNVTVNGTIKGYKAVGGFAGLGYTLNNDSPTSFINCTNNANLISSYETSSTADQYSVVGGFIGEGSVYNYNGSWGGSLENKMIFDNCRNNGSFEYLGSSTHLIACFSNFIGFSSDGFYGSFYFNNCSNDSSVSYTGTLASQRTVSTKTVFTGYSAENAELAPTIKYIGITSNVWSANTPKNAIYVDGVLVEGSTADHIQITSQLH